MQNPPTTGKLSDTGTPVLLFDGHCHLCSGAVRFIIKHEAKPVLLFAPLQSSFALQRLREPDAINRAGKSIVIVEHDRIYEMSDAAIRTCSYLRFPWRMLTVFRFIPRSLRDLAYNFIAKRRYKWFGRSEQCWLPDQSLQSRFRGI